MILQKDLLRVSSSFRILQPRLHLEQTRVGLWYTHMMEQGAQQKLDEHYMQIAIEQAELTLGEGNFPVGAVLIIDNQIIGKARNLMFINSDWISHAEMNLLKNYSAVIKKARRNGSSVTLYSTFEPCLMCLGASVMNRISKIIYACPDPFAGAACVRLGTLPARYGQIWPIIEKGPFKEESQKMIVDFISKQDKEKWKTALKLLQNC